MDKIIVDASEVYLINHANNKYTKIQNHPYYLSLIKKEKTVFEKYVQHSKYQSMKPTGKWENFISVYKSIKKCGFDYSNKDKITFKCKNGIFHCIRGRHRICMLYKIFKNVKLCISNNILVNTLL